MRAHSTCTSVCWLLASISLASAQVNPVSSTTSEEISPVASRTLSASGISPSGNATCEFSAGDLTNYLECKKDKVSTTTLIAAALGVTVGVLVLVGLCVFMCHRSRKRRAPNPVQKAAADTRAWRQQALADKVEDYLYHEDKRPPLPAKGRQVQRGNDSSDEDLLEKSISFTKPGRHQAPNRIIVRPRHPDSPVEMADGRVLYPSNPSPAPRHLREPVVRPSSTYHPGRRQSAYQPGPRRPSQSDPPEYPGPPLPALDKPRSKATEHSRATFGAQPKTPMSMKDQQIGEIAYTGPPQSQAGTRPLNVRKSSAPSMLGRPRPPPEGPPPALPHPESLPEVPVVSIDKSAIPQSATIPKEDVPSAETVEPPQAGQSPPLRKEQRQAASPVVDPPALASRRSMMQDYAIPSYYEASRQSVYDQSRSRAPSTYIPRSRSGSVDVLPDFPQSRSAPDQARPSPNQPLVPLRQPSVPNAQQARVAPDRSQTTLARPVSRVQGRSMVGQSVSIDPFTEQAMPPMPAADSAESFPKQRRKPSQASQADSDNNAKVSQRPAPSRQQSSTSTQSATSSQRPLLARDESTDIASDERFVDAVETIGDEEEMEEQEVRSPSRLDIPVSSSQDSSSSPMRRSPSVDRGGLI